MFARRGLLLLAALLLADPLLALDDAAADETTAAAGVVSSNFRSPRATMKTLLASIASEDLETAGECLDLSALKGDLTPAQRQVMAGQHAQRLKDIIDRMAWVDYKLISDLPDAETYRFGPTADDRPIVIERQASGAWLFSDVTVAQIDNLWEEYKDKPKIVSGTPWYRKEIAWLGNPYWRIGVLFLSLLLGLIVGRITKAIINGSANRLERRESNYATAMLRALARVSTPAICLVGLWIGLEFLIMVPAVEMISETIVRILAVLLVAFAFYALVDVVDQWMQTVSDKTESKLDDMLRPLVRTSLRTTIVILGLVQLATILSDKPMTSVIAGLGVGGLAIGLASQDMVKNFFGSIMIFSDHPFEMGDSIEAGGHAGSVESVGFRSTRLRTSDGHVICIPNGALANMSIKNISARKFLKRSFGLGLTYDTSPEKMQQAIDIVREILDHHEGMGEDNAPRANFTDFTDSTLNIQVVYWHFPADWTSFRALNDRVNAEILTRFNAEGIEMAFPSQTIYMSGAGE
jgi:MscS family membrane protein